MAGPVLPTDDEAENPSDMRQDRDSGPSQSAQAVPQRGGLREQVVRGGAFMMVRQFVSMGLSVIGIIITTHILGPERFGPYAAALGIQGYLQNLGQAGIGVYLVRATGDTSDRDYHIASTLLLAVGLALAFGTEAGMSVLGRWVGVSGFQSMLSVLLIVLPFQCLSVAAGARLERALDFRRVALIEMGAQILYYIVTLPLILLTPAGPWALVAGWMVQQSTMCLAFHVTTGYLPRPAWDTVKVQNILSYTLGFTAANWVYQLRNLVNPLIVGHFLGAQAIGIVGVGIRLLEMLAVAKTIAWRLSVAALARVQHDPKKLVAAMTQGMQLQTLAIAPLLLGFSWFGGALLPYVFGARWMPVMDIYPFLALSYMTNAQFNVHSSVLYVMRRNWDVAMFHIVHVGLFATGAWFAVQHYGVVGYGWGEVAGLIGYAVLHWRILRAVGSPEYRVSGLWWAATAVGLFWQHLGVWAVIVPFLALFWPESLRQIKSYAVLILGGMRFARA